MVDGKMPADRKEIMKLREIRSIVDLIRDAHAKDLVIISLLILPAVLGAWSAFLNTLTYLNELVELKFYVVCGLFVLYVLGIIQMKRTDSKNERLKRARYHIETRLRKRPGHRASYEAIRNEVNPDYDDKFIEELIDQNPDLFSKCTLKKNRKPGITLDLGVSENPAALRVEESAEMNVNV